MTGRERGADAGTYGQGMSGQVVRLSEAAQDAAGEAHGLVLALGTRLDDRELVATQSRDEVPLPNCLS